VELLKFATFSMLNPNLKLNNRKLFLQIMNKLLSVFQNIPFFSENNLLNYNLLSSKYFFVSIGDVILIVACFVIGFLITLFSKVILNKRFRNTRLSETTTMKILSLIKFVVWGSFLYTTVYIVSRDIDKLSDIKLIGFRSVNITLEVIFIITIDVMITRFLLVGIRRIFERKVTNKTMDSGVSSSVFQIIQYMLWLVVITIALDVAGLNITLLLAGSTAILVGLGLGLQKIFTDVLSGIVLLIEHKITVGDFVEVDKQTGIVKEINLRASTIVTMDNIVLVVPNSRFLNENLINWNHQVEPTRFHVDVTVDYNCNIELVKKILIESAEKHPSVDKSHTPFVRYANFGDSGILFQIFFWSKLPHTHENIKSDIRFSIFERFTIERINIPFPQTEVSIKNENLFSSVMNK